MENLEAVSPLDGRYNKTTQALSGFFSEAGFFRYRVYVETEYLIALSKLGELAVRELSEAEIGHLRGLYENFSLEDAKAISEIEKTTNHDVKAVEYFIKHKLAETTLADCREWVHFALTSEDVNNVSHALMVRDALEQVIVPALREVHDTLDRKAADHKEVAMLARTHGQPASPTTFGKELKVYAARLGRRLEGLADIRILAKLNGATGNYNAHVIAYPKVDWVAFSKEFIESFNEGHAQKLEANLITTQIESHDSLVAVFDTLRRINTILIGFDQDIWRYISDDWIVQKAVEGEVGSSAMPHKVNPIKFENSEGNLGLANALFEFFARKLPVSRLQRDLSDSTVLRNIGSVFSYSLIGYENLLKGLERVQLDEQKMAEALEDHPEVVAEAIQTVLRREGVDMPYEKLKELTRGKKVSMADLATFIDNLEVSDTIKEELKKVTPGNYTGLASQLSEI